MPAAGLALGGGTLIALGSRWHFTEEAVFSSTRFAGAKEHVMMTSSVPPRQLGPSTRVLPALLVGAILLMSLAADMAIARPPRRSVGWALLTIGGLIAACVAVVGASARGTTTSVGDGYVLAAAGCVLVLLGACTWVAVARPSPQRSAIGAPRPSMPRSGSLEASVGCFF